MKHLQTSKEIIRAKNFHTYLVFTVSGVEIIHLTFGTVYTATNIVIYNLI